MNPFLKWLIGLRQIPQEAGEGAWHLEFQSLPHGFAAVLSVALGLAAIVGVWVLYKWEGRNLGKGLRLVIGGLRLLALATLALMLIDIVLVIDRRERARSHLLVLVDTSESMNLTDPYDDASARRILAGGNAARRSVVVGIGEIHTFGRVDEHEQMRAGPLAAIDDEDNVDEHQGERRQSQQPQPADHQPQSLAEVPTFPLVKHPDADDGGEAQCHGKDGGEPVRERLKLEVPRPLPRFLGNLPQTDEPFEKRIHIKSAISG